MIEKRYFIVTDIHGSQSAMDKAVAAFAREKADVFVSLGDIYYHGPRNPLPDGYAPMEVCKLLKGIGDENVLLVRGNCDSEVDEMVTGREFWRDIEVVSGGKKVLFTHGHKVCAQSPVQGYAAVVHGHTHINNVTEVDGTKYVNLSSAAMPKENAVPCYAILADGVITVNSFDGETQTTVVL